MFCAPAANGVFCQTTFRPGARFGGIFDVGVSTVSGHGSTGPSLPKLGRRPVETLDHLVDVDIADLQPTHLARTHAGAIGDDQHHFGLERPGHRQETLDFVDAQNHRDPLRLVQMVGTSRFVI